MILRQIGEDQARKTNVAKSVEIAKQAIKLDFKDGKSWYTMGNAYMSIENSKFKLLNKLNCRLSLLNN